MLGWEVEWNSSFRNFFGVVTGYNEYKKCWLIFEFVDRDQYEISVSERLVKVKPSIKEYIKAVRSVLQSNPINSKADIHTAVVDKIKDLPDDSIFKQLKTEYILEEYKLKRRLEAEAKLSSPRASADSKLSVPSPASTLSKKSKTLDVDGEEEEEDDDDDDDEDDSDEDSDEDDSDEDTSSDEDDEDEDEDDSTSDSSVGGHRKRVDIKIYIMPSNDIRGFCVKMDSKGLATIYKRLNTDYGALPKLFYKDTDGDLMNIKSSNDLQYAYSSARSSHISGSLANSALGGEYAIKLKLFAEFDRGGGITPAASPVTKPPLGRSESPQRHRSSASALPSLVSSPKFSETTSTMSGLTSTQHTRRSSKEWACKPNDTLNSTSTTGMGLGLSMAPALSSGNLTSGLDGGVFGDMGHSSSNERMMNFTDQNSTNNYSNGYYNATSISNNNNNLMADSKMMSSGTVHPTRPPRSQASPSPNQHQRPNHRQFQEQQKQDQQQQQHLSHSHNHHQHHHHHHRHPNNGQDFDMVWKRGEVLGSGSFGQVYSGINLANGERIAVKEVILGSGRRQREQAKALQQEVRILSSLHHPNIIQYYGTEFAKDRLRIFLELATQGTLRDAVHEFGRLPEPLIRSYTADILSGLQYLHSKRLLHRDIKPTNLLVSNGVVKIADFGCSSFAFGEEGDTNTASGGHATVAGTTIYMAPEVLQVEEDDIADDDGNLPVADEDSDVGSVDSLEFANIAEGAGKGEAPLLHNTEAVASSSPEAPSGSQVLARKHKNPRRTAATKSVVGSAATTPVAPATPAAEGGDIPKKKKKRGYGRKADIWSLGITLCELAAGTTPFKSAGAAIYAVCISKKFPTFPATFSNEAHRFMDRCLVYDPADRANCDELLLHPFLIMQSMDVMRAQTAASSKENTSSSIKAFFPEEFLPVFDEGAQYRTRSGSAGGGSRNGRGSVDDDGGGSGGGGGGIFSSRGSWAVGASPSTASSNGASATRGLVEEARDSKDFAHLSPPSRPVPQLRASMTRPGLSAADYISDSSNNNSVSMTVSSTDRSATSGSGSSNAVLGYYDRMHNAGHGVHGNSSSRAAAQVSGRSVGAGSSGADAKGLPRIGSGHNNNSSSSLSGGSSTTTTGSGRPLLPYYSPRTQAERAQEERLDVSNSTYFYSVGGRNVDDTVESSYGGSGDGGNNNSTSNNGGKETRVSPRGQRAGSATEGDMEYTISTILRPSAVGGAGDNIAGGGAGDNGGFRASYPYPAANRAGSDSKGIETSTSVDTSSAATVHQRSPREEQRSAYYQNTSPRTMAAARSGFNRSSPTKDVAGGLLQQLQYPRISSNFQNLSLKSPASDEDGDYEDDFEEAADDEISSADEEEEEEEKEEGNDDLDVDATVRRNTAISDLIRGGGGAIVSPRISPRSSAKPGHLQNRRVRSRSRSPREVSDDSDDGAVAAVSPYTRGGVGHRRSSSGVSNKSSSASASSGGAGNIGNKLKNDQDFRRSESKSPGAITMNPEGGMMMMDQGSAGVPAIRRENANMNLRDTTTAGGGSGSGDGDGDDDDQLQIMGNTNTSTSGKSAAGSSRVTRKGKRLNS